MDAPIQVLTKVDVPQVQCTCRLASYTCPPPNLPPRQPETYSRRWKKCGVPLRQPKFVSAATTDFFTVRRRRGGFHELLLHL